MEALSRLILRVIVVLTFISVAAIEGIGQSEGEANDTLYLQHQTNSDRIFKIDSGRKLKVWTQDGQLHAGTLTQVSDSSFFLGKDEIRNSNAQKIKLDKGEGSRLGGIGSIIFGILGALLGFGLSLLGLKVIDEAPAAGAANGCAYIFLGALILVLGIAIGVVGAIFIIAGIVAFAVGKAVARNFRLDGKWRIIRRIAGN